jgi:microsomal epoxide hydrolase
LPPVLTYYRIGEKYLEWVDSRYPLELQTILELVSLYWFTSTFPRSLYPYRPMAQNMVAGKTMPLPLSKETPLGYSAFHSEISFVPKTWAERAYPNLKLYRLHDKVRTSPTRGSGFSWTGC